MKNKVVRLYNLPRLEIQDQVSIKGYGPCALQLSNLLNCWNDNGVENFNCKPLVVGLKRCMGTWVWCSWLLFTLMGL